jgi:hypothetical protein
MNKKVQYYVYRSLTLGPNHESAQLFSHLHTVFLRCIVRAHIHTRAHAHTPFNWVLCDKNVQSSCVHIQGM